MYEDVLMENPLGIFDELITMDEKEFEIQNEALKAVIDTILNSEDYYRFLSELQLEQPEKVIGQMKEYKKVLEKAKEGSFGKDKAEVLIYTFEKLISNFEEIVNLGGIFKKIPITVTKVRENAILPKYQSMGDAGADIYAAQHIVIEPKETVVIPSGVKVAIPGGYCIEIVPRSGMSLKTKLRITNTPGTIDCLYRGEVGVIAENVGDTPIVITEGMRIAQMKLVPIYKIVWNEISNEDFDNLKTDRGNGFGSSGV